MFADPSDQNVCLFNMDKPQKYISEVTDPGTIFYLGVVKVAKVFPVKRVIGHRMLLWWCPNCPISCIFHDQGDQPTDHRSSLWWITQKAKESYKHGYLSVTCIRDVTRQSSDHLLHHKQCLLSTAKGGWVQYLSCVRHWYVPMSILFLLFNGHRFHPRIIFADCLLPSWRPTLIPTWYYQGVHMNRLFALLNAGRYEWVRPTMHRGRIIKIFFVCSTEEEKVHL